MSKTLAVTFVALATGFASQATAQIPGDSYFIVPGLGSTAGIALASSTAPTEAIIDGLADPVGTTLPAPTPTPITSLDTIVDNGGGNFTLTIRVESTADVAPLGFTVGGLPADIAGCFIGANGGGSPVAFSRAAIVNTATISVLDVTTGLPFAGATFDVSGFADFADPAFGGGWNGSFGVTFGAGSAGGIGGYELIVDYNEGALLGQFNTSGAGCPTGAPVFISADTVPVVGGTTVITANDLPANTVGATLFLGSMFPMPVDLMFLGSAGCTLNVNPFIDLAMTVAGTTASFSLALPANPAIAGLAVDGQAILVGTPADTGTTFGLITSDAFSLVVGD